MLSMNEKYDALIAACRTLDQMGKVADSIQNLTKEISMNPIESLLYYQRGLRLENQGNYALAINDFSKAAELNPTVAEYFISRARLRSERLGQTFEAIADLEIAVSLNPDSPTPHQHLCLCYLLTENIKKASNHAKIALELNPNDGLSYFCFARCLIQRKEFGEAAALLKNAVQLDSTQAIYWAALGDCNIETDSLTEAVECYENAFLHERRPSYLIKIAKAFIDSGQSTKASQNLNTAAELGLNAVEQVLVDGYRRLLRN